VAKSVRHAGCLPDGLSAKVAMQTVVGADPKFRTPKFLRIGTGDWRQSRRISLPEGTPYPFTQGYPLGGERRLTLK
jgi:hypothetical protein